MKLYLESLGCDKNRVDAEKLLFELLQKYPGSSVTDEPSEAEIAIVNTCSFIGPAKEESIQCILDLAQYKETGKLEKLIVAGCLVERYKDEIRKELPEIDEITSVKDYVKRLDHQMARVESGEKYSRYLKIAEGCDKYCSYCIIPRLRGHYRSIPKELVLEEARALVSEGAGELILVAQETTLYGTDLYKKKALAELLAELSEIPNLQWIRILYCYPEEIEPELIREMKRNPKVCHYLDLPIQHASDRILKRMNRHYSKESYMALVKKIREILPDVSLTTDIIVGFPGETEEDFQDTMEVVAYSKFDSAFTFQYSKRTGTPAAKWEAVPEDVVKERFQRLLEHIRLHSEEREGRDLGKVMEVLVEEKDKESENMLTGRLSNNVLVHFEGGERLIGEIVPVRLDKSMGFYYYGSVL